jgi:hypothetical protein
MSRKKAVFAAQIRQVLADGAVSAAESDVLLRMQRQFRLSDAVVMQMMADARKEMGIKN